MTFPFYCVAAAFLLNYLSKVPLAHAMNQESSYDNRHPRDQQARLTGWGRRALAAHLNSFEITPIFAVSVIVAHLFQADPSSMNTWAAVFVGSRIVYHILYMANIHVARTSIWGVGALAVAANFYLAA